MPPPPPGILRGPCDEPAPPFPCWPYAGCDARTIDGTVPPDLPLIPDRPAVDGSDILLPICSESSIRGRFIPDADCIGLAGLPFDSGVVPRDESRFVVLPIGPPLFGAANGSAALGFRKPVSARLPMSAHKCSRQALPDEQPTKNTAH